MFLFLTSVLIILCVPISVVADEKSTMHWSINDAAPFYIFSGKEKGQGLGDLVQKHIIKNLPNYDHLTDQQPLQRVIWDFDKKREKCFSTWIYNTKSDLVYTSIPYVYYPPYGIITQDQFKNIFNMSPLTLDKVLQNSNIIFGRPSGRGYGSKLDETILKYQGKKNIIIRSAEDSTFGIMSLLIKGRIHFTYDYAFVMEYFNKNLTSENKLTFLPSQEQENRGQLGSIACTKSPWGKKMIDEINNILFRTRNSDSFKAIIKKWLINSANQNTYWSNYRTKVLSIPPN